MLMVTDIGNTHTVIGIYQGEELKSHWRISTDLRKTEDELAMLFRNLLAEQDLNFRNIDAAAISCVVPPLIWIYNKVCSKYCQIKPLVVDSKVNLNIQIKTDYPEEMGADRLVNAVAVKALYGTPAIIIDFGTATTFCALDKGGNYIGGAIAPGLELASNALFTKTAKLPKVELVSCTQAIGRNTVEALQSGIFLGHLGLIRELTERFREELGGKPLVIATGGYAELLGKHTSLFDKIDPLLSLAGLKITYQLNK